MLLQQADTPKQESLPSCCEEWPQCKLESSASLCTDIPGRWTLPKTCVFVCSLVKAVTFSPCFGSVNLTLLQYRFNTMRSVLLL